MILHPRQDVKGHAAGRLWHCLERQLDSGPWIPSENVVTVPILGLTCEKPKDSKPARPVTHSISDALSQSNANLMPNLPTPRLPPQTPKPSRSATRKLGTMTGRAQSAQNFLLFSRICD